MTLSTLSDGYMMRNVLELPEILRMVLECLRYERYERDELFTALQVNKTWYMEVIRILWANPPPSALAAIERDDRRQFYARFIRELNFDSEEKSAIELEPVHSAFRNLEFPRLKYIKDSNGYYDGREKRTIIYRQYIQPSLEIFNVSPVSTEGLQDTLDLLSTRCPRLEKFGIGVSLLEETTSVQLMNFFDNCRSLKAIRLAGHDDYSISDQLLAYFAGFSRLEELSMGKNGDRLYKVLEMTNQLQPFRNIRILSLLYVDSNSVPLLVEVLKNAKSLTELNLGLHDFDTNPLPHVSSLVNLQELSVTVLCSSNWCRSDFLALSKLKNLKVLGICSSGGHDITCPEVTDEDFSSVFENLTELEKLDFGVNCDLSIASLNALGTCCRKLVTCRMIGRFDLDDWFAPDKSQMTLFPCLELLQLDAVYLGSHRRTR